MITKTIRSRFSHEVGEKVEGCTILEKRIVIPPAPSERRLGVYDYVVEAPPATVPQRASHSRNKKSAAPVKAAVTSPDSFTRSTPDEMSTVIRRLPSR